MTDLHRMVDVDGARLHVVTAGQGSRTPLVLLHGGGVDSASLSWAGVLSELARERQVVAFDWPGYGSSPLPGGPVTNAVLVDVLGKLLDHLRIERAILMGISMGGAAALGYALERHDRAAGLVLVDSYGLQRKAPMHLLSWLFLRLPGINQLTWSMMRSRWMVKYTLGALLKRPGALTDELLDEAMRAVEQPGANSAWSSYQNAEVTAAGLRTCYMDRLGELKMPVLVIQGEKDTLVPAASAREAHSRIAGSRLEWIEGSGHWPQRDNPESFLRVVSSFLNEMDGTQPG